MSFWLARLPRSQNLGGQKLAKILAKISKSRRDSRRDLGEISKSRQPKTRRESRLDLGEISKSRRDSRRDLRISAAKTSPTFSPRSLNLGGQKLAEILAKISKSRRDSHRDLGEISKSRRPKTHRESRLDLEILAEISKSRQPNTRRNSR